ncbi:MAG: response regulator [Kiritimatiellae bacterium]|nr:response regulator [Kiritimatiellia bacterium]
MKKEPSLQELEKAQSRLLAALCPAAFPDTPARPAVLDWIDADLLRSLAAGLELTAEESGLCKETRRFLSDVLLAAGDARRAWLAARIELLEKAQATGQDQAGPVAEGVVEVVLPVRLRGQIVHGLTSGPLLTRALSDKDIERLGRDVGLPAADLRKRADRVPVLSRELVDALADLLRLHRDGLQHALEHRLRARELADELVQSERTRSLGALSGGVAHHFNNLLSVILGYASFVLNREKLSREATDGLQKICEAAQRGRRMTEELLAFTGSDLEEEKLVHVHDTLKNVLSLLSSQTPSGVRTETHLGAKVDEVMAPPSAVRQVVFNLLSNALDSMATSGRLTVTTRNAEMETESGPARTIQIEVADSGGLLPHGFKDRQAEPPEAGELQPGDRMGLRLASVYGIVGRLEGSVVVSSKPGALTRVEVNLPVARGATGEAGIKPKRKRLAPSTIWVVDDDPTFREMCRVVLAEEGHTVEGVADGREMQKKWSAGKKPPDLIIIDFSMPEYNGLELCQWLARQGSRVPVILVSGLSPDQPDIHKALEMKRTHFLQKPFSFREMSDVVTVAMGETLIGE